MTYWWRISGAMIACLLFSGGCGEHGPIGTPPSDRRILGKWTAWGDERVITNEYRENGTMVQHAYGKTSAPHLYRIDGETIIYTTKQWDGRDVDQKQGFRIEGDALTIILSPGVEHVYRRDK